jgi:hypothetical protein
MQTDPAQGLRGLPHIFLDGQVRENIRDLE